MISRFLHFQPRTGGSLCAVLLLCVGLVQPATASPQAPTSVGGQGTTLLRTPVARNHPGEQEHAIAEARSQTSLLPTPALRAQIERTQAFLATNREKLDAGLFRLKNEGLLDRRGRSRIRSALERARDSLSRLAEDLEANKTINGWTARMVSYELGTAADTLAQQAGKIDTASHAQRKNRDNAGNNRLSAATQALSLADRLKEGGNLIRETAHAIVRHLQ